MPAIGVPMRLTRSLVAVSLSACLGYCAVVANASPSRRSLEESRLSLAQAGGLLARMSPAAGTALTLRDGFYALRDAVRASALMHDSRQSDAASRREFVALWADLESGPRHTPGDVTAEAAGLIPGQD